MQLQCGSDNTKWTITTWFRLFCCCGSKGRAWRNLCTRRVSRLFSTSNSFLLRFSEHLGQESQVGGTWEELDLQCLHSWIVFLSFVTWKPNRAFWLSVFNLTGKITAIQGSRSGSKRDKKSSRSFLSAFHLAVTQLTNKTVWIQMIWWFHISDWALKGQTSATGTSRNTSGCLPLGSFSTDSVTGSSAEVSGMSIIPEKWAWSLSKRCWGSNSFSCNGFGVQQRKLQTCALVILQQPLQAHL